MDNDRFADSPVGHLVQIRGTDGRQQRAYEHVAFVATPLGAEPVLKPETWHSIGAAHRALARLDAAARLIPNPGLLRRPTLSREAQSTSALEGTFAPIEEVLAADLASDGDRSEDLSEVLNYLTAAEAAFAHVHAKRPLTAGFLESVHGLLVAGTKSETVDAGRVRTCQVAIGSANGAIEESRFVPMPPGADLEAALRDLTRWIGDGWVEPRDALVATAQAHYQFESIHPFNDGNGRIGRLLVVLQFMLDGLLSEPLISVSPWFEARRVEYQDRLADVSARGDWDGWIQFFAQGIEASADDTAQRTSRLLAVQAKYVQHLQSKRLTGVIRDIADVLVGSPVVTVPDLAARVEKTQQAVNTALLRLVQEGLLDGPYGTYNRRFVARDVLNAVSAPMGRVPGPDEPLRGQRRSS